MDGIESLLAGYRKVIQLISRTDPLLAYDLDSASITKQRLTFIDQYVQEAFHPILSEGAGVKILTDTIRSGIMNNLEDDAINELERNLKRLATRLGPITWLKVTIRLRKRNNILINGPQSEELEQLIEQVLLPAISAMQVSTPAAPQKQPGTD